MQRSLVGREREISTALRSLELLRAGPAALLIEGEAGIGKSALWRLVVDAARERGLFVLEARPSEAERHLPYAALGDLLAPELEGAVELLPAPQRRALEVALLVADPDGEVPDQRAIAVAILGVLRGLAAHRGVALAIDDVQWLDADSARALTFATRRLTDEPVLAALTRRGDAGAPLPLGLHTGIEPQVVRLSLGPIGLGDLRELLIGRLGLPLARPLLMRVHNAACGNPLYGLEIGRALTGESGRLQATGELPLPASLDALLDERLARLSTAAREALAVVATLAHPTPARVAAVSPTSAVGLDEALDAGLVVLAGGRLHIGHPLYGSVAFARLRPAQRAALHRRLAELVDDSEERALHLAHALQAPDRSVARTLIEAARRARARGAPEAALELAEHALRLWPVRFRVERQTAALKASDFSFAAGDTRRARRLLDDALVHADGVSRAAILERLATLSTYDGSLVEARDLAEEALACIPDDSPQRVIVHRRLALVYMLRADLELAERHAHAAVASADARGATSSLARALANAACISAVRGRGRDARPLIARALSLEGDPGAASIDDSPSAVAALLLMYDGEHDVARQRLRQALVRAQALGGDPLSTGLLFALSELETRAGRFEDALALADRGLSASEQADQGTERAVLLFAKALAGAHLGSVDSARDAANEGIAIAERTGHRFAEAQNRWALGLVELSLARATEAWAALSPAISMLQTQQVGELGVVPVHPEAIEALLALGHLAAARDLLEELDAAAHAPWMRAATTRCRGLVQAAAGEPDAAIEQLEQAAEEQRDVDSLFAVARTLQALGAVQRRVKRRSAARKSLESAVALFQELGARQWELRATGEIARLGGRRARDRDELTPTELRVAELAAGGRSNREIAGELFVTESTVEANLTRTYRKLGVRSRTELARRLPTP